MLERLYLSSYERLVRIFDKLEEGLSDLEWAEMNYYAEDNLFKNFNVYKVDDFLVFTCECGEVLFDEDNEIVYDEDWAIFKTHDKGFWGVLMLEKYVEIYENEFKTSAFEIFVEDIPAIYDEDGWLERDCEENEYQCGYTEHFVLWLMKQFGVDLNASV